MLEWGTGAMNIDDCRVDGKDGRWPANLILSHDPECRKIGTATIAGDNREGSLGSRPSGFGSIGSDSGTPSPNGPLYPDAEIATYDCVPSCPIRLLDEQAGTRTFGKISHPYVGPPSTSVAMGTFAQNQLSDATVYGDSGGTSRFFLNLEPEYALPLYYCPKASRSEREAGLDSIETRSNRHPTVKPVALMVYLCRLVTPPGGTVLDPFCGSGSTGIAAVQEGFSFVGIEQSGEYVDIARLRIGHMVAKMATSGRQATFEEVR